MEITKEWNKLKRHSFQYQLLLAVFLNWVLQNARSPFDVARVPRTTYKNKAIQICNTSVRMIHMVLTSDKVCHTWSIMIHRTASLIYLIYYKAYQTFHFYYSMSSFLFFFLITSFSSERQALRFTWKGERILLLISDCLPCTTLGGPWDESL